MSRCRGRKEGFVCMMWSPPCAKRMNNVVIKIEEKGSEKGEKRLPTYLPTHLTRPEIRALVFPVNPPPAVSFSGLLVRVFAFAFALCGASLCSLMRGAKRKRFSLCHRSWGRRRVTYNARWPVRGGAVRHEAWLLIRAMLGAGLVQ